MAIRAEFVRSQLSGWLAIAVLACSPSPGSAQGYAPRAKARVDGAQISTPIVEPLSVPLTNVPGRDRHSLNGKWQVLVDGYSDGISDWKAVWKDRTAAGKTQFFEYGFDDSVTLDVPGDFNTQRPELTWLEGSVWYRKAFDYDAAAAGRDGRRLFVHFGAANYRADVFLNGQKLGSHEGGFTPFQFELTGRVRPGKNQLLVHVNNERRKDGIPARGFDSRIIPSSWRATRCVVSPAGCNWPARGHGRRCACVFPNSTWMCASSPAPMVARRCVSRRRSHCGRRRDPSCTAFRSPRRKSRFRKKSVFAASLFAVTR
jgi:hypothetical protein